MTIFGLGMISITLLVFLFFVDRKIKGGKSVVLKIISLAFFTLLVVGTVYLYGTAALESYQIDVRSFTKIKTFFSSRIVTLIIAAIFVLFLLISIIHVTFVFFKSKRVNINTEEKSTDILSVSYDIDVIPDNSVLSMETNNLTERLVNKFLVFSITRNNKKHYLVEDARYKEKLCITE